MADWLVELRGHTFDLEDLANLFTTPDLLILKEGEEFLLKSTAFDALANADEVYAKAKSLMPSLNGIASVYVAGYRNVGMSGVVVSIDAGGTRKRHIYLSVDAGDFRIRGSADVAGDVVAPKGPTPADAAIGAALKEEVVSRALRFFGQTTNWVNLYKVLDAIREDLGGKLKAVEDRGWVAASEIGRFTGTANNHTAASGEARHGFDFKGGPIANPMSLNEAEELIRTLLREWLKSKN